MQEELLFKQIYIIHCNLFLEKEVKDKIIMLNQKDLLYEVVIAENMQFS